MIFRKIIIISKFNINQSFRNYIKTKTAPDVFFGRVLNRQSIFPRGEGIKIMAVRKGK